MLDLNGFFDADKEYWAKVKSCKTPRLTQNQKTELARIRRVERAEKKKLRKLQNQEMHLRINSDNQAFMHTREWIELVSYSVDSNPPWEE